MTVINTNIGALHAHQYSKKAELFVNKALERLSSGKRINQASDDAAGLAVASKMTSQMLGMRAAVRNTQDGISLVQTAESGMKCHKQYASAHERACGSNGKRRLYIERSR